MTYGYDPNTDYQKLINQDLAAGDYRSAAIHEAQRNEKIRGEGAAQYQTTDHYAAYLPKTEEIDQRLAALESREPFRYDANTDPSYQAYRKQYLREADRQTRDAMGSYAAMTGGIPSTAALTAAQQAGNYQRAKLTDKIPELEQAAYGRYTDEFNRDLSMLQQLDALDQGRASESAAARSAAVSQALQIWANAGYANEYVSQILGVPVGTLTTDQAYQQLTAEQQAQQSDVSQALSVWQTLGYANDFVSQILGVPVGTLTSDQAYQQWTMQGKPVTGGGSTGGSGGGSSGGHSGSGSGGAGDTGRNGGASLSYEQIQGIKRTIDTLMGQGKRAEAEALYNRYKDYL